MIQVRAKRRGQEFKITPGDIKHAVLDAGLYSSFKEDVSNVHIDRIDCLQGYVRGNIQALHWRDNLTKAATIDKQRHAQAREELEECPF